MEDTDKKVVLIVEDNRSQSNAMKQLLASDGLVVHTETNGKTGLEKALELKPDAIVVDVLMPEVNGLDMLAMLRKDEWGKQVPVIVLTNLEPDDSITAKVADTEPSYYLVKTETSLNELSAKLHELLFGADANTDAVEEEDTLDQGLPIAA